MARILVVYFSRTGHTRQVARSVAEALRADVEEVREPTGRAGVLGYLRSGRQAFFRTRVPILAPTHDPADYDLIVVGTPVWNMSLSAPVRSWLRQHRRSIRALAAFCTCGGAGDRRTFRQIEAEAGRTPVATLTVREADLEATGLPVRIAAFASDAKRRAPGGDVRKPA